MRSAKSLEARLEAPWKASGRPSCSWEQARVYGTPAPRRISRDLLSYAVA